MNSTITGSTLRALNETDIREEIAVPLLALLGYKGGTENEIIREMSLTYNRDFIGRKRRRIPHCEEEPIMCSVY